MNNQKVIVSAIAILVVISGLVILDSKKTVNKAREEPVSIGGIFALTGLGASQGEQEKKGAELAIKEINDKGGINGRQLRLISEDVSLDKLKMAGSAASKLINVDKVVAIVGTTWDEPAQAILPIIEEAKIPMVGQNQTRQLEKERPFKYFFSTWYNNEVGIDTLLSFAKKSGFKRVAIIRPVPAGFYQFVSDLVTAKASGYGITITDNLNANDVGLTDIRTSLAIIKSHKPDAVLTIVSAFTECAYLKQAKEIGLNVPMITTESARDMAALSQCPSLLENVFISYPKTARNYPMFELAYKNAYGLSPETPSVMTAYDAVKIIANGLEKTDSRGGEELQRAIAGTKDFDGVSLQKITFDDIGYSITPIDSFEIQTVRDGKFVSVN